MAPAKKSVRSLQVVRAAESSLAAGTGPLVGKKDVARFLGVSVDTVERLVKGRELRAVRIREKVRFRPVDVHAFIEANLVGPITEAERGLQ